MRKSPLYFMNSISRCFKEWKKLFISTRDDVSRSGMGGTVETTLLPSMAIIFTLPETNIAPARKPSQKDTSLPTIQCQMLC